MGIVTNVIGFPLFDDPKFACSTSASYVAFPNNRKDFCIQSLHLCSRHAFYWNSLWKLLKRKTALCPVRNRNRCLKRRDLLNVIVIKYLNAHCGPFERKWRLMSAKLQWIRDVRSYKDFLFIAARTNQNEFGAIKIVRLFTRRPFCCMLLLYDFQNILVIFAVQCTYLHQCIRLIITSKNKTYSRCKCVGISKSHIHIYQSPKGVTRKNVYLNKSVWTLICTRIIFRTHFDFRQKYFNAHSEYYFRRYSNTYSKYIFSEVLKYLFWKQN